MAERVPRKVRSRISVSSRRILLSFSYCRLSESS
uniref:Uncharacterized protein n=1 Tax=Parascaris equorum TaxID=6256 RepID=A0A914SBS2_PAREQ